jgi:hypothetical protein
MTMPAPSSQDDSPKVMFIISGALSPDATKNEPVAWAVGQQHPFLPGMSVIGLFIVEGGVEIYAASAARKGVRSFIPMHWVRYIHEEMPSFEVFSEEFNEAVAGGDEDDFEDDDTGPESAPTVPPPAPVPTEQPS